MRLQLLQLWPIWDPRQVLFPHNLSMVRQHRRHWRQQVNRRGQVGQILVGMGPIELGATRTIGGAPRLWHLGEQLIRQHSQAFLIHGQAFLSRSFAIWVVFVSFGGQS